MTRLSVKLGFAAVLFAAIATPAAAQTAKGPSEQEAHAIARDAYVYAYPVMR